MALADALFASQSHLHQLVGRSVEAFDKCFGQPVGIARGHQPAVFAGQDPLATARAREFMPEVPPSSPSIFLFKDGELAYKMHRHQIEGRDARSVAIDLMSAFSTLCAAPGPSVPPEVFAKSPSVRVCGSQIPTVS